MINPLWKEKTPRSAKYLDWIRTLYCCCCGSRRDIVAHHENLAGHGAKAMKCSDFRTLPMCPSCHNDRHQYGRSFYTQWKVDPERVIKKLNQKWDDRHT